MEEGRLVRWLFLQFRQEVMMLGPAWKPQRGRGELISFWIYFKVEPIRIADGQNVGWKRQGGAEDGFKVAGLSVPEGWDQVWQGRWDGADLPGWSGVVFQHVKLECTSDPTPKCPSNYCLIRKENRWQLTVGFLLNQCFRKIRKIQKLSHDISEPLSLKLAIQGTGCRKGYA